MKGWGTPAGRIRVALVAAIAFGAACAIFAWRFYDLFGQEVHAGVPSVLRDQLVILVVAGAACAFAIALTASWLAIAPVSDLTRTVHAMKRDLAVRSQLRGKDEVGELGEALDDLASWLGTEKASLEEDRDRLAAILESMAEGVLVTRGSDGAIVLANAALREMLLLDRRIVGRSPQEVIRVAGLDDVLERAEEEPEGASGEIELGGLRPRRILIRAAPLRGPGDGKGMVLVFNDVTELRRLETMRRDFVANVSHELRTPITAIRAAGETLAAGAIDDPVTAKEFCEIITRNAARLQSLVEDLLELSRIEARQWKLDVAPVDVRDAAQAAFETMASNAKQRGTRLVNSVSKEFGTIAADRRALEQVLTNLVDNAVKYAGASAKVEIGAERADGSARIRVRDDGPGIQPHHLPRIFERFYRVDAGRSRAVGGTGLGLSIVKHLVEAMGGKVEVESEMGVGTTFVVTLRDARKQAV
jgi:two-component system phosphate regulon sensor histidine kinase PhoR